MTFKHGGHDAILIDSGRKTEIYRRGCPWEISLHQPRLEDAVVIGLLMASENHDDTRGPHLNKVFPKDGSEETYEVEYSQLSQLGEAGAHAIAV